MQRIAGWNSARDVWETDQVDLLSGRSDVYSETFTISGSMRNGVAYALPTSGHLMDGSGSLFSQLGGKLIPTPRASDGAHGGPNQRGSKGDLTVSSAVALLPTATAADANGSGGSNASNVTLTDAVVRTDMGRQENVRLLPSPVAQPSGNSPADHLRKKPGREVVTDLAIIVENGLLETGGKLLPSPTASEANGIGEHGTGGQDLRTTVALLPTPEAGRTDARKSDSFSIGRATFFDIVQNDKWGEYAPAIARWEAVLMRLAPEPTEPNSKDGRRLSSSFVEWMMGLPEGWVTDPALGLSRTQQLKMLGNGVVTQQAIAALQSMRAARSINEGETNHE